MNSIVDARRETKAVPFSLNRKKMPRVPLESSPETKITMLTPKGASRTTASNRKALKGKLERYKDARVGVSRKGANLCTTLIRQPAIISPS